MRKKKPANNGINLTIRGNVANSQVAVGSNIRMRKSVWGKDKAEALRPLMETLKAQVKSEAPPDLQEEAMKQVSTLEAIISSSKPDLSKIETIRGWLIRHIPALAGRLDVILRELKSL